MYLKPLQIGDVTLKNNLILAPMAGITDKAFRQIVKPYGPGLVYTEMVSAKAIFYHDEKTKKLYHIQGEERPISIQIFGSDEKSMAYAAEEVSSFADLVDINLGCPAPKVVKNGDGSKLLTNLDLAGKMIETVVKYSKVPVTVKIRKGWDNEHIVAVEIAKIAEELGAKMITVHGRTRDEFYSGKADWEIIKQVKENVKIPVIGNGDISSYESAKQMFEITHVDGIMCARGVLGNPWLFEEIINGLEGKEKRVVSNEEKLQVMLKHLELEVIEKGEVAGVKEMRKHISWYVKKLKDSSKMREKVNTLKTKQEVETCLREYFSSL